MPSGRPLEPLRKGRPRLMTTGRPLGGDYRTRLIGPLPPHLEALGHALLALPSCPCPRRPFPGPRCDGHRHRLRFPAHKGRGVVRGRPRPAVGRPLLHPPGLGEGGGRCGGPGRPPPVGGGAARGRGAHLGGGGCPRSPLPVGGRLPRLPRYEAYRHRRDGNRWEDEPGSPYCSPLTI